MCVINAKALVKSRDELKIFAPLGCGIQTGMGTIISVTKARSTDTVVTMVIGGVGFFVVMGAKIAGCRTITGIDRVRESSPSDD